MNKSTYILPIIIGAVLASAFLGAHTPDQLNELYASEMKRAKGVNNRAAKLRRHNTVAGELITGGLSLQPNLNALRRLLLLALASDIPNKIWAVETKSGQLK